MSAIKDIFTKLKDSVKTLARQVISTMKLFMENGLANHAAACAYGFLLSVMPMLLLITFFIIVAFDALPQSITTLLNNFSFLDIVFVEQWLNSGIFSVSKPGISGIVSVLSIFWASGVLVFSMRRGLNVVFSGTKKRNPVTDTLVTLASGVMVMILVLVFIFGSHTVLRFLKALDFLSDTSLVYLLGSKIGGRIFSTIALGIVSFLVYLLIPVNSPRKSSALFGAMFCALLYGFVSVALGFILDQSRYNFIYGTLGSLIILLVKVYFFFTFFFFGAQYAYTMENDSYPKISYNLSKSSIE